MKQSFYYFFLFGFLVIFGCKDKNTETNTNSSGYPEIEKVSQEIVNNPNKPELYMQRAKFFYEKNLYDRAIPDVLKAISLDSLNPVLYHFLSDCYLDSGDGASAKKTMFKVLGLYPERVPSLLKTAEIQYILEEYENSILTINQAVKVDAQNAECYFMLGVNFRALDDIPRAINSFQTAVEMDSKLTDAWLMLGELMEKNKDSRAQKYYESAVLSDPASPQAKHALAYYYQNHNNIPKALELYREIIISNKDYQDAYLNSGILYRELDSLDRAYEQFNILTGIAPTNANGFYFRGLTQKDRGKINEAVKDLETALNLDSDNPDIIKDLEKLKSSK